VDKSHGVFFFKEQKGYVYESAIQLHKNTEINVAINITFSTQKTYHSEIYTELNAGFFQISPPLQVMLSL
jgi:hypothetical protein